MRILVVEDDPGIGELVCEDLRDQGYAVDWAQDGHETLSLLESFPYDLMVLDLMLPGASGFEITQLLRAEHNPMPILMLTAKDSIDDRVKGLESGADDYLVKPFHLKELRARVLALLRRARGEASNIVSVGRLTLDLSHKRAWFEGSEVQLTSTEYVLLEFLALHTEATFNRNQLLEHAWSAETNIDPRSVDTYIRYLRRKLGDDAIETRRGFGYRFRG
jgi:DNA-binding response OmpR family regulator